MRELSLHVLDLAQNSVAAGADRIEIGVYVCVPADTVTIEIADNGKGMTDEQARLAADPFYTTRTERKIGLGIPLFKMAAETSGGSFSLWSECLEGTRVCAVFGLRNMNRVPAGDFPSTLATLIQANPDVDFEFTAAAQTENETVFFRLDTREIRELLGDVSPAEPEVYFWLTRHMNENLRILRALCPNL